MKRTHALLISVVLALAVILGSFAAIRSTQLSTASATPRVGSNEIARQNAALSKAEAALRAQLARRPPAIPTLGRKAAVAPQTVVYRRAPTIVHVIHRHGGEHDDGSGGFDD